MAYMVRCTDLINKTDESVRVVNLPREVYTAYLSLYDEGRTVTRIVRDYDGSWLLDWRQSGTTIIDREEVVY